jgi:hypothetical protein
MHLLFVGNRLFGGFFCLVRQFGRGIRRIIGSNCRRGRRGMVAWCLKEWCRGAWSTVTMRLSQAGAVLTGQLPVARAASNQHQQPATAGSKQAAERTNPKRPNSGSGYLSGVFAGVSPSPIGSRRHPRPTGPMGAGWATGRPLQPARSFPNPCPVATLKHRNHAPDPRLQFPPGETCN